MKEFLKKKGVIITAAVTAAALLLGVTAYILNGRSVFVTNAVNTVMRPIGSGVGTLFDFFEGIYGYMFRYDSLKAENEALKKQIAGMEQKVRDGEAATDENERLRKLNGLRDKRANFEYESATIIAWGASTWTSTFTISKGSSSGIELHDCVVNENHCLVGQVIEVGTNTATVRTVIDTNMNAGALIERTGAVGIVCGDFAQMQKGCVKLMYLPDGAEVQNGDTIMTSGKGGLIPQGLVIGTVTDVAIDESGMSKYAVVKPDVTLGELSQIFIIKSFEFVE